MNIEELIAGAGNPGNIFDVATDALAELQDELEQRLRRCVE